MSKNVVEQNRRLMRLSQSDLATKSGVKQPHISELENSRRNMGDAEAEKLATALKTDRLTLQMKHMEGRVEKALAQGSISSSEAHKRASELFGIAEKSKAADRRDLAGIASRTAEKLMASVEDSERPDKPETAEKSLRAREREMRNRRRRPSDDEGEVATKSARSREGRDMQGCSPKARTRVERRRNGFSGTSRPRRG